MSSENDGDGEGGELCAKLPKERYKVHDRLIENVNSWGNIEYNVPLRTSKFETRTTMNVGHRFIPPIPVSYDTDATRTLPDRLQGRDRIVGEEQFKTTQRISYDVKPNPNSSSERADCAINCKRTIYMTGVEKRLQRNSIKAPRIISETKDTFRGVRKSPMVPEDVTIKAPDPEYVFDVVACGRNEAPVIPETASGFRKQMDPYLTTYRNYHRLFSTDDQYGIGAKDQITFYSEFDVPKVRGFGPRHKEIWMPLLSRPRRQVIDRIHVKKECHEVAASHNPVANIKGRFQSENRLKYKIPFTVSELVTWDDGEIFDLAPFPPNPYQTNIAPFMYCSDYCHIADGSPVYRVVDQHMFKHPPHRRCKESYIVSRDFTV